jgi:ribonuclease-3
MATERSKSAAGQPGVEKRGRGTAAKSSPWAALEEKLGYKFAKPALLKLALTHRSHPYEARTDSTDLATHETKNTPGTDNEQLEFVGDAVLGLAVTELLYKQFPDRSEGELTRMRASLVSRQRMAALGTELGLGEHLLVGKSAEQNGARRKPALLANAAEAVLAAIYLDANGAAKDGFREVRRLVEERLLKPELAGMKAALATDGGRGALRDAKTLLQERVQATGVGRLRYADTDQSGPAHQRRFKVEARIEGPGGRTAVLAAAEGASKKEAQQRAAELALKHWKESLPDGAGAAKSEDAA